MSTHIDHDKIVELAQKYGLTLVVLFGSQATGKTHKESDVDIAFLSERQLDTTDEIQINYALTLICHNDRVDSVNLHIAHPLLLMQIVTDAKVLYEKQGIEFAALEVYALRRFREAQLLYEIRREKLAAFTNGI